MRDHDPYRLHRFVAAQEVVYGEVVLELRSGLKTGHWMWFIFPQLAGLGHSAVAQEYAISSRNEAEAYLQHPVLGPRLRECTQLVNLIPSRSAQQIFGSIDSLKFCSSMTLFAHAGSDNQVFLEALQKYYGGDFDPLTLQRL